MYLDAEMLSGSVCILEAEKSWYSIHLLTHGLFSFGSFGMAYDFIDSVGNDVDVVSDSEVSVIYYLM
jgi:hypothetical protein